MSTRSKRRPSPVKVPAPTIQRVVELLAEGMEPPAICERLGVSEKTVCAVRDGYAKPRPNKRKPSAPDPFGIVHFHPMADPVWCEACKAHVKPPCLACQIRKQPRNGQDGQKGAS